MPEPIAICLEAMNPDAPRARYTRCVAVSGAEQGLGMSAQGEVLWRSGQPLAFELWVSADEKLILLRPAAAPPIRMARAGRFLDVPFGKPVVLLDQDEFTVAGRCFRLHVHGPAEQVHPPEPFAPRGISEVVKIVAAVALGAAAAGCPPKIDVRDHPPKEGPIREDAAAPSGTDSPEPKGAAAASTASGNQSTTAASTTASASGSATTPPSTSGTSTNSAKSLPTAKSTKHPPIDVRPLPPRPVAPKSPKGSW